MSRNTWRNIFIGIILLTIPCYLFGIFVFYYNGGGAQDTPTPSAIPSRTPINVTELALTDPSLIVTDIILTNTPGASATPVVFPTTVIFTSVPFFTTTPVPTRFITSTPTTPAPITNTPVPSNTSPPTATQPILLPPTNTPSP